MNKMISSILLGVISGLTVCGSVYAGQDNESNSTIEEVIVMSTKMGASNLQSTAAAITAMTETGMEQRGIEDMQDLSIHSPGFSFSQNEQFVRVFMRGIGSSNDFLGSDPSSTVHVDGVYIARPVALFTDFADVERIEVLRGPQGTLYGRNSVGGTINVITKKPTNEFHAKGTLEYGTANRTRFQGHVSGPVIEDRLMVGIAVTDSRDDGHVKNLHSRRAYAPDNLLREDIRQMRGVLRFIPAENVEAIVSVDYSSVQGTPSIWKAVNAQTYPFTADGGNATYIADRYTADFNAIPESDVTNWGISGKITWDISEDMTLTSITAYRESELFSMSDIDSSELAILECCGPEDSDQLSQEIQFNFTTGEHMDWVAGLYYFKEEGFFGPLIAEDRDDPSTVIQDSVYINTEAYAVFAQTNYQVSDQLRATAGIRYSYEVKDIDADFTNLSGDTQKDETNWTAWTPKFGLDYQLTDEAMIYGSVTRGFKSGGYNSFQLQESFDPEEVLSYELGAKADWLDNKVRTNLAVFYYDYTDLQVQTLRRNTVEISNAADATITGMELEVSYYATDSLMIDAGFAYLDAQFDEYIAVSIFDRPDGVDNGAGGYNVDVSGRQLPSSPKTSFNLGMQYDIDLADKGGLNFRVDYHYQSKVYFTQFNDDITAQDAYGLVDARMTFESANGNWKFSVFGKNLFNEEYFSALYELGFTSSNDVWGQLPKPRTYGIQVSLEI